MPKTSAEYKSARRRRAIVDGFCATCCVNVPINGRSVCSLCSERASARTTERRHVISARRKLSQERAGLESLGDQQNLGLDHRAAKNSYERALAISLEDPPARTRLAAKVGKCAFVLGIGTETDEWFNVPLDSSLPDHESRGDLQKLYQQKLRTLWSTARTAECIAFSERVLDFAASHDNRELLRSSQLGLVASLVSFCRNEEARASIESIDVAAVPDDEHSFFSVYYRLKGGIAASFGAADEAFSNFVRALYHAERCGDAYQSTAVYLIQGFWAIALGRLDLAAIAYRDALTVARSRNFGWTVATLCLDNARILSRQGSQHLAHAYVNEAAVYDSHAPPLLETLAEIGIPIAIACGDSFLLAKCANDDALASALRSREPWRVGPVAASFAQYYVKAGRPHAARALLNKALYMVSSCEQSFDLLLTVAEFSDVRDVVRARALLDRRLLLPNAAVAQAHRALFEALAHKRSGRHEEGGRQARIAADQFAKLGWVSYAHRAQQLFEDTSKSSSVSTGPARSFASFGLSSRERIVAELATEGFSNRVIADKIGIKERTVEFHMTAILGRIGLRSRHQLGDIIGR